MNEPSTPISKDLREIANKLYDLSRNVERNHEALRSTLQAKDNALAAKDEQIEELVDGILDIDEWMSGRNSHICPFCRGVIGEHRDDCLRTLAIVIKEANDG